MIFDQSCLLSLPKISFLIDTSSRKTHEVTGVVEDLKVFPVARTLSVPECASMESIS